LQKHWESIPFLAPVDSSLKELSLSLQLAFWLGKPITLVEILESSDNEILLSNALFSLLELGCSRWARENLHFLKNHPGAFAQMETPLLCHEESLQKALSVFFLNCSKAPSHLEFAILVHLLEYGINTNKTEKLIPYFEQIATLELSEENRFKIDALLIWIFLLENQWEQAGIILESYPIEILNKETLPFHFLFGCYLWATEGEEIARAHFANVSESPYPPTSALLGNYLLGRINLKKGWITQAFFFEKIQLFRQLALFYHCTKDPKLALFIQKKLKKELGSIPALYSSF
jgi:serine/threonine-protein kinase